MDSTKLPYKRRASIRPAIRRLSIPRPADYKPSSVRWLSDYRRPSLRGPDGHRRLSTRTQSEDSQGSGASDHRHAPDILSSERRSSARTAASSSDSCPSAFSSEYDGSDEDEESEQAVRPTIKTNVQMDRNGLGLIIIQNGPYLQLTGLVEKSVAAEDGKLEAGDVLLKIGHANVLGYSLRELRQLLQGTPVGTVLQIQVYRDFLPLPGRWTNMMSYIPEMNDSDTYSDASEGSWTSSEDQDTKEDQDHGEETDSQERDRDESHSEGDHETVSDHLAVQDDDTPPFSAQSDQTVMVQDQDVWEGPGGPDAEPAFCFMPSSQLQWVSRDWHFVERRRHTFTVGSDIGCDIMIHKDYREETIIDRERWVEGWSEESDSDTSTLHKRWPYWTMPKVNAASSSSSSSLSDVFWLTDSAEDVE